MKKILVLALFLAFAGSVSAQEAKFPSNQVKEINVYVDSGKLFVRSADTKEVSVSIHPQNQKFLDGIRQLGGKKLLIMAKNMLVDKDSIITIKVPLRSDIEIDSVAADIVAENLSGELEISAEKGSVQIKKFKGDLNIDAETAQVKADGEFRDLNIETGKEADVQITLVSLPVFYEYEIEGTGNITFYLLKGINKKKLNIEMDDFRGNLNFEEVRSY